MKTKCVTAQLPEKMHKALLKYCNGRGQTISAVLKNLIYDAITAK